MKADSTTGRTRRCPSSYHYANDGTPKTGGDLDSVGVLQQRVGYNGKGFSKDWGPVSKAMDPEAAMRSFAAKAKNIKGGKGAGRLAQKVQASAHPDRYDKKEPQAHDLIYRMGKSCPAKTQETKP